MNGPERLVVERHVATEMRDGATLRATILRPDTSVPVPALLSRTPYDKEAALGNVTFLHPYRAAIEGYAVVLQDVRGRFASDGDEWPPLDLWNVEGDDGYDTIEWTAAQSWCDGDVGMVGGSYLGEVQYAAAGKHPPHLRAIAPSKESIGEDGLRKGAMWLESITLGYFAGMAANAIERRVAAGGDVSPEHLDWIRRTLQHPDEAARTLPLSDLPLFEIPGMVPFEDAMRVVQSRTVVDADRGKLEVPALLTSGYFDNQGGADMFHRVRALATSTTAREETRLILGPWSHNLLGSGVGEWGFGGLADVAGARVAEDHLAFFARNLRGADVPALPPVRYFVMRANDWRTADHWPPPDVELRRWYLRSSGGARSVRGDGRLSVEPPARDDRPDRYRSDPMEPVPSVGGRVMYTGGTTLSGPFDQRRVEERDDVLVYTTAAFEEALELVGDVVARLHVSSSAPDTDFVVKLCDVGRDGRSRNLVDGWIRMRYRDSWEEPSLLSPDEVYSVEIPLGATGVLLPAGHRLRLQVASTSFPHLDRNMNTGNDAGADAEGVVADQTVHHSLEHPSHVEVPLRSARPN